MMVIVVGPDGAGKTTLVNDLRPHLNPEIVYKGLPQSNYMKWAFPLINMSKFLTVLCDRFHYPDDEIYSAVLNIKQSNSALSLKSSLKLSLKKHAHFVFLDAPDDVLTERYMRNGDSYVTLDQVHTIQQMYRLKFEEMSNEGFNTLYINEGHVGLSIAVDQTYKWLERHTAEKASKHVPV